MRIFGIFLLALMIFTPRDGHADDIAAIKAAAKGQYINARDRTARDIIDWYKLKSGDATSFREGEVFINKHPNCPT